MYRNLSHLEPPETFALISNTDTPDDDGDFQLTWGESIGADNYTIYRSNEYIINIDDSQTIIAEDIGILSYDFSSYTNGTYYFIIEAKNNDGSTLSNCIEITIKIPPQVGKSRFSNY